MRRFRAPKLIHRVGPWLAAAAALGTILVVFPPNGVNEAIDDGNEGSWLDDLLGGGLGGALNLSGEVKQYTIQYEAGELTNLGSAGYPGEGDFAAQSTATSGSQARFDLVAEGKTLRTRTAPYAEQLTYFLVTVPTGQADTLVVTVGSASLEVEL